MNIRKGTRKDFESFISIKRAFCEKYGISRKSKEFIFREFIDYLFNGAIIIAIDNGEMVGYLLGQIEEDMYEKCGYIGEIFVTKKYNGIGIASRLKNTFMDFLKLNSINMCRIDVNPNNPAQKVYKSWGFKIDKFRMCIKINNNTSGKGAQKH